MYILKTNNLEAHKENNSRVNRLLCVSSEIVFVEETEKMISENTKQLLKTVNTFKKEHSLRDNN